MTLKMKLTSTICAFLLILGLVIMGVMAAPSATVNLGGHISFKASEVFAKVSGTIEGVDEVPELDEITFKAGDVVEGDLSTWQNDLVFKEDGSTITITVQVENLATDRPLYVTCLDTIGLTDNVTKSIANGAFILEEKGSDNNVAEITFTMRVSNPNMSLEDAIYGYDIELLDESAIPEEFDDFVISEGVVTEWTWENGDLIVPSYHKENGVVYPVTAIGEGVFEANNVLTNITLPQTLETLGECAFDGASELGNLVIPAKVTSIGEGNKPGPYGKVYVDENNTVYDSRDNSFTVIETENDKLIIGCNYTVIPDSVTEIGDNALSGCQSITNIIIPDSVTTIGDSAFNSCSGLTSITIPDSVTSIGDYAFAYCSNLTSLVIGNKVETIGDCAFDACSNLTSVVIGNKVETIGDYAFSGCSGLTSITIPDSVTEIGDSAFQSCSNLTSITIPDSVTEIRDDAFNACNALTTVNYRGTEEQWKAISIGSKNEDLTSAENFNFNYTEE